MFTDAHIHYSEAANIRWEAKHSMAEVFSMQ